MKMNGSAMIFIGGPDLKSEAEPVCEWVGGSLRGGRGARLGSGNLAVDGNVRAFRTLRR